MHLVVFQFLIGRLKTRQVRIVPNEEIGFQFLIGRLKTLLHSINQMPKKTFQFLIGRLKTRLWKSMMLLSYPVSIPYR